MLKKISTFDAMMIVVMAVAGLVVKPVIGPILKLVGSTFFMSSGSISGVIYMIFPMLACLIVRQTGAATLTGLIQGIMVLISGIYGSHGIISVLTYTLPGVAVDVGFLATKWIGKKWALFLPTALGNLVGNLLVGVLFLRLPKIPLLITLIGAFVFGGFSGFIAWYFYRWLAGNFPVLDKQLHLFDDSNGETTSLSHQQAGEL